MRDGEYRGVFELTSDGFLNKPVRHGVDRGRRLERERERQEDHTSRPII